MSYWYVWNSYHSYRKVKYELNSQKEKLETMEEEMRMKGTFSLTEPSSLSQLPPLPAPLLFFILPYIKSSPGRKEAVIFYTCGGSLC